ncbi:MAG: nuclear transport factor 2 family protein [Chloroflexi bacterium]|nr:nuclear transport factor 2 family protein [Chloroflexota bacterium]
MELDIVRKWHAALNGGDVDELVTLVQGDVEVGGPRGASRGAQVVREWFGRANVRLNPTRFFCRKNTIIVEARGEWLSEGGRAAGAQDVATVFVVKDGLISRIVRYDDLESAFRETGLDLSFEIKVE